MGKKGTSDTRADAFLAALPVMVDQFNRAAFGCETRPLNAGQRKPTLKSMPGLMIDQFNPAGLRQALISCSEAAEQSPRPAAAPPPENRVVRRPRAAGPATPVSAPGPAPVPVTQPARPALQWLLPCLQASDPNARAFASAAELALSLLGTGLKPAGT